MAWIEIIEGPSKGICAVLTGKLTVGRTTYSDLHLNDSSISRRHLEIWNKGEHYALVDVGSSNGTLINGQPLHEFIPHRLNDNDQFVIGTSKIVFHTAAPVPECAILLPAPVSETTRNSSQAKTDFLPVVSPIDKEISKQQ